MSRIVPILDGHFGFDPRLIGPVREAPTAAARLLGADALPGEIEVPVWCYLIETSVGTGLVDTGGGRFFGSPSDRLATALADHGVAPEAIARVWLTHLHGDHCGGLIADGGVAAFPNARVALPKSEARHWLETAHDGNAAEIARDATAALAPYEGQIDRVDPGDTVDGATAVAAPGHTPGHMAWEFGKVAALAAGDIFHVLTLQLPNLDWSTDWDSDPEVAATTRRALLEIARDRGLTLLTGHAGALTPDQLGRAAAPAAEERQP
ncbi:MAG: MBL fold metallo-hydrolase [Paracoccaceae bacterium]|nr:MBL fold metallo-hydrolase [Paracoccaceae bacterium]